MAISFLDVPSEVLRKIALFAVLASPLGAPKELRSLLLTCRAMSHHLSPPNAVRLYFVIFASKFDARGPLYRLGVDVVREHAALEMRRRFSAIQIFKRRQLDDPALTEALWIAYLMVEDSDTSQKNVKQLLSAGVPTFLDRYLRFNLKDGPTDSKGWPVLTEQLSLAIALSWTLASQRVMSYEPSDNCLEMMHLLRPVVFAAFRYSIFRTPEEVLYLGRNSLSTGATIESTTPYPPSVLPPQEIQYFGGVRRKAQPPFAALFATLLYFVRMELRTPLIVPNHIKCQTREEANQRGLTGLCADDIRHFHTHCRTRFADFPGIDFGIQTTLGKSPDIILCQPSFYKTGTIAGQWQGSEICPDIQEYTEWRSPGAIPGDFVKDYRRPLYITLEEHYTCDSRSAVPLDDAGNGSRNAWLPSDVLAKKADDGMEFCHSDGSFRTIYQTWRRGQSPPPDPHQVADVIITGTTDDPYLRAWGGYTQVLGRVRMKDGLVVLVQRNPVGSADTGSRMLRGYDSIARKGCDDQLSVGDMLSTTYVMMLENEEKNRLQLVEYGQMNRWIHDYWFDNHGMSHAIYNIRSGTWPKDSTEAALGMWLFWFLLRTDDYEPNVNDGVESPMSILKAMALGAHKYPLTTTPWVEFKPTSEASLRTTLYGEPVDLTPPPLATPAILSFLALVNKRRSIPLPPSEYPSPQPPDEWSSEWGRCFGKSTGDITECFRPGSIEGVWEGFFTYTEFTAYAAMLAGASPTIIQKGVVGRHQQTWKLREHHLLSTDHSDSDSGIGMDTDDVTALRGGDPLRSYFPTGTQLREHKDGLTVQDSDSTEVRRYHRTSALPSLENATDEQKPRVKDIILTGEGHSAWGQFNLVGRIRPCDGFISLSKDYVDGDRGKWLYRGYLVGNANGNLAGRWRDTLSPADVPGYEGCFFMSRRR
ncbi:hypothetical protein CVT26_015921 [Gymnopilus dilepis]|uniref:F-box domain-containing protein n=1 Tax=Gymnopilus dilepis TaxID=231916 RepID=A0A409XYI2_9AGAR|nr:hypothetical protein CVT26_015921 [Gymnopilus dilepis]